jgi:pyruvate formate lyase activating enzyme
MNGRIVDIKRMAVHDGPGIRTTVFMKGCPLSCDWCHNPESIAPEPEIGFYQNRCINCGRCITACPNKAHAIDPDNGQHAFNRERCQTCGKCVEACLMEALEYYGQQLSVAQTVAAVIEDRTFYEVSGGGCTLSGGEPLLQDKFCAALFKQLKHENIHCAIDTSGAVDWKSFEAVLPYTDIFLYDLKHTDETMHLKKTGASNRIALDNLLRLSTCDIPIEIRIPFIPGFNTDCKSINSIVSFIRKLDNISDVCFLPYHKAAMKYKTLGLPAP